MTPFSVVSILLAALCCGSLVAAQDAVYVSNSFETQSITSADSVGTSFDSDVVHAVHMRSSGTFSVFGVDVQPLTSQSDVTVSGAENDDWWTGSINGGSTADDTALEGMLRSINSVVGPTNLIVNVGGLVAGERYTIHVFQVAESNSRREDKVFINAVSADAGNWIGTLNTPLNGATRSTFSLFAQAASHSFVLEGDSGGPLGNPLVAAIMVTRTAELVPASFVASAEVTTAAGVASLFTNVKYAVSAHPTNSFEVFGTTISPIRSTAGLTVTADKDPDVDWSPVTLTGGTADDTALAAALQSVEWSSASFIRVEIGDLTPGGLYTLSLFVTSASNGARDSEIYLNSFAGRAGKVGDYTVGLDTQSVTTFQFVAASTSDDLWLPNSHGDAGDTSTFLNNPTFSALVLQEKPQAQFVPDSFSLLVITDSDDVADSFEPVESVVYAVHVSPVPSTATVFGVDIVDFENEPRVDFTRTNVSPNDAWGAPNFGSDANDNALESVTNENLASGDDDMTVHVGGLTPGNTYRLSILQTASSNSRRLDGLFLNGAVQGPYVGTLNTPISTTTRGAFNFVATDTSHDVTLEGGGPTSGNEPLDNPLVSALVLQDVTPAPVCDALLLPSSPTLINSSISGADLVLEFESNPALSSLAWNFVGGAGCDNGGTDGTGGWVHAAGTDGCPSTHTLTKPVTALLATCGFSAEAVDGGDVWYYEAVVEATAVNDTSAVFGDDQTRTDVTSFRLRVEFPKNVSVSASSVVFGPVISQARVTTQLADTSAAPAAFEWTLATSVQHPYELVAPATTDGTPAGFDAALAVAGSETCTGTDECTQRFTVSGTASASTCSLDGSAALTFTVKCRDGYTGSCDLPSPATVAASFAFETDDFCPQVVEVASITPALTTYSDSDRTSVSTNYILETTLFARVTADVEAGLRAQRTTLTGLDIVSSCTGCGDDTVQPFPDTSAAATAYGFAYASGGTDNSATGEVETDFSFTLNTNSLSFDNDASTGEAQITLTAYLTVEYDTPSVQGLKRSYRVQAVSGPGSIGSSASTNFGVSGTPAGGTTGGSSSTAGSTVLGVSTGTAALAAVGLAAVAAVAFGAAVAARHRRRGGAPRIKVQSSSSSSIDLSVATVPATEPASTVPGMAVDDLGAVQTAYDSSRV